MGDSIALKQNRDLRSGENKTGLEEMAEGLLADARNQINADTTLSVPIAQLATLGTGVSSLVPFFNTVSTTVTVGTQGLYTLTNAATGDALKIARNGNFWGALKTVDGGSKFAQFQEAGPLSAVAETAFVNPAVMMMAVAIFSVEQQIGNITEMERQIISFLEVDKESEIEADLETLMNIIKNYKHNWDNEHYIASNHKMVLDIQRTARKNMNSYQKKVSEAVGEKQFLIAQTKVRSSMADLEKKFKYYRLSLYTFSLASLTEIMLGGNFREEYISGVRDEIRGMSEQYRDLFGRCSVYLENISNASVETKLLKGIGTAGRTVGKLVGSLPCIKEGTAEKVLQESSSRLENSAVEMEREIVRRFAECGDPKTKVYIDKMEDMIRIYNHTSRICADREKIYLITE